MESDTIQRPEHLLQYVGGIRQNSETALVITGSFCIKSRTLSICTRFGQRTFMIECLLYFCQYIGSRTILHIDFLSADYYIVVILSLPFDKGPSIHLFELFQLFHWRMLH